MKASETTLLDIVGGTKQYIVPLFQRPYCWEKKQWDTLWEDLLDLIEGEQPRTHFLGSIVTMQTLSVPEGVPKYTLIDGQQRLTTLFVLMAVIRDCASELGEENLAKEVNETMIVNPYKQGTDRYRLNPTQSDRPSYFALIERSDQQYEGSIAACYAYFRKLIEKSRQKNPDIVRSLKDVISNRLSIVSIVLGRDDNPHLVFESLNAKGSPLTQADLIRNYFLMRVHSNEQDTNYREFWAPMQNRLEGDLLTEFIRHFLMKDGGPVVKKNEVYFELKERFSSTDQATDGLRKLNQFSQYYHCFIDPEQEADEGLRIALARLKRIEITTAYPFLLNCYSALASGSITSEEMRAILNMLENYLVRRFICNRRTSDLNKIFPQLFSQANGENPGNLVDGVQRALVKRGYPSDAEFRDSLLRSPIYGAGDKQQKAKFLLDTLESSYGHKEKVSMDTLSIEHVLPQTITEWWKEHLGSEWGADHDTLLHSLGNLTLTGYNPELSNKPYFDKKGIYEDSHVHLNTYFSAITSWRREEIVKRTEYLAERCIEIWPSLGEKQGSGQSSDSVRGRNPHTLYIMGQSFPVDSWVKVLSYTLEQIADLEPDKFQDVASETPHLISTEPRFRRSRQMSNGYYFETNRSAEDIYRFCRHVIVTVGLSDEDWKVETNSS